MPPPGKRPRTDDQEHDIASVEVSLFRCPLAEVLMDAKHGDHSHFELICATVTTVGGAQGVGYTYTGGKGGTSIKALLETDLAPLITGMDSRRIEKINDTVRAATQGRLRPSALISVFLLYDIFYGAFV
jgi:L-alanine-DL-glutamate epimerase-like enolase superfamily enzyme